MAYKRDIDDVRESPALDIILLLEKRGARVSYSDPWVPELRLDERVMRNEDLDTAVSSSDCAVIVTDHKDFDYGRILSNAKLIIDTRNAMKGHVSDKIVRL